MPTVKKHVRVKNPCKICFKSVNEKTGIRCQGACKKWMHFDCLDFSPGKILDIKLGYIQVKCPCPNCETEKENSTHVGGLCGKAECPAEKILDLATCGAARCASKKPFSCPENCVSVSRRSSQREANDECKFVQTPSVSSNPPIAEEKLENKSYKQILQNKKKTQPISTEQRMNDKGIGYREQGDYKCKGTSKLKKCAAGCSERRWSGKGQENSLKISKGQEKRSPRGGDIQLRNTAKSKAATGQTIKEEIRPNNVSCTRRALRIKVPRSSSSSLASRSNCMQTCTRIMKDAGTNCNIIFGPLRSDRYQPLYQNQAVQKDPIESIENFREVGTTYSKQSEIWSPPLPYCSNPDNRAAKDVIIVNSKADQTVANLQLDTSPLPSIVRSTKIQHQDPAVQASKSSTKAYDPFSRKINNIVQEMFKIVSDLPAEAKDVFHQMSCYVRRFCIFKA